MKVVGTTVNGAADFGKKVTCTISRNGDLVHRVYLRVELPAVTVQPSACFRWLNWVGHILIKSVEVEIGGQRIKSLVSPEKYHAPGANAQPLEEKHLVVRTREKLPTTQHQGKATDTSRALLRARRRLQNDRESPKAAGYQAVCENARWPRLELGYGNNPSDENVLATSKRATRSQDPSAWTPRRPDPDKVQRLNGDG